MPYLSQNRSLRLTTLCALYAAQGMPDGFVRTALKTHLISEGVSTAAVGQMVALVSWPWALKWVWGPVLDRFSGSAMGRRRPWILAAQFMMGLTLTGMSFIPDLSANLQLLGAAVLLVNCFAALQDVSVDALAIDILPERERGVANGFMFGSSYIGSFVGGAVLGRCLMQYGLRFTVLIEVLILAAIAAAPLLLRERPGDVLLPGGRRTPSSKAGEEPMHPTSIWQFAMLLKVAFSRRSALIAGGLALLSLVTINAHLIFWPVYLQRFGGWSAKEYLMLEGGYSVLFGLGGSLLGGVLASWLGAKRTVIASLALIALSWFLYPLLSAWWDSKSVVILLFLLGTGLAGVFQVSLFALFMGVCWKPVAATQFTAYMALLNLSNGLGALLAGYAEALPSLSAVFIVMGCFQLALIAVVIPLNGEKTTDDTPQLAQSFNS